MATQIGRKSIPEVTAYVPGFGLFFRPELNSGLPLPSPLGCTAEPQWGFAPVARGFSLGRSGADESTLAVTPRRGTSGAGHSFPHFLPPPVSERGGSNGGGCAPRTEFMRPVTANKANFSRLRLREYVSSRIRHPAGLTLESPPDHGFGSAYHGKS
jgi:hypothetical protein